jgi:hypothetical protein
MPYGKGTYGSKVGRPPKKGKKRTSKGYTKSGLKASKKKARKKRMSKRSPSAGKQKYQA